MELSGGFDRYPIIHDGKLPDDVRDEVCDECVGNDSGRIFNPKYYPKLKAWLEAEGHPVVSYIIWFSW